MWIKFYLLHIGGIKSIWLRVDFVEKFQLEMDQLSMRTSGPISPIDRIYQSFLFFVVISNGLTYFQLIKIMHLCGASSSLMKKLFWNRCWFGIRHPSKSPLTRCVYSCWSRTLVTVYGRGNTFTAASLNHSNVLLNGFWPHDECQLIATIMKPMCSANGSCFVFDLFRAYWRCGNFATIFEHVFYDIFTGFSLNSIVFE